MRSKQKISFIAAIAMSFLATGCFLPKAVQKQESRQVPEAYRVPGSDTTNTARLVWRDFFEDANLNALIDEALRNNQELNITLQEIEIARNEVRARKGEYLPFVNLAGSAGLEKRGRYTNLGSSEATTDIKPGTETPEPLPDFMVGAFASWEVDVWKKLRNAKKSAYLRYLSSVEGKNFLVTNLVAEIVTSYYELLALDNQLEIVRRNIQIQSDALEVVKLQKEATRVTELAVKRFEAQVLHTRGLQFEIQQRIVVTENRINFLVGRYPQHVNRVQQDFETMVPNVVKEGVPSQLLLNRPDIRQAELLLSASKLDIKSARANLYPSLTIRGGVGYQAFNTAYLIRTPESLLYSLAGDLTAPLINRNAIKAMYLNANARQVQAAYDYERSLLNGYIEVVNQLSNINNLVRSVELKASQVEALNESVSISNNLFKNARADYMEVLLTQRDALESRFELIDLKQQQMNAMVSLYRALGGGWR